MGAAVGELQRIRLCFTTAGRKVGLFDRTLSRDPGDADLLGVLVDVNVEFLTARATVDGGRFVVHLKGELDASAGPHLLDLLVRSGGAPTCVDMSQLTFMDCAGYGALAAACAQLPESAGNLRLRGSGGQPHVLLLLIDGLQLSHPMITVE